ncbi:MAG: hypothetical protein K5656_04215 [Lachnospiraceae bacterium]|nr:hypothetical protein [Lachnospiraceae bacterium]
MEKNQKLKWLVGAFIVILMIVKLIALFDSNSNNNHGSFGSNTFNNTENAVVANDNTVNEDTANANINNEDSNANINNEEANDNDTTTAETESILVKGFRNAELRHDHFLKHGRYMGFDNEEDYEKAALAVVSASDVLHKIEAEDGDDVYYLERSNEFVIVSTDGYLRTYFYPDDGKDYFDRQ